MKIYVLTVDRNEPYENWTHTKTVTNDKSVVLSHAIDFFNNDNRGFLLLTIWENGEEAEDREFYFLKDILAW